MRTASSRIDKTILYDIHNMWFYGELVVIKTKTTSISCIKYNPSHFYIRNIEPLAIFCGCTARFVSDLIGNPEDRLSHHAGCLVMILTVAVSLIRRPPIPRPDTFTGVSATCFPKRARVLTFCKNLCKIKCHQKRTGLVLTIALIGTSRCLSF